MPLRHLIPNPQARGRGFGRGQISVSVRTCLKAAQTFAKARRRRQILQFTISIAGCRMSDVRTDIRTPLISLLASQRMPGVKRAFQRDAGVEPGWPHGHAKPARAKRGGANRDRTGDLLLAKQALSQLSYGPRRPKTRDQRSEGICRTPRAPEQARLAQQAPSDL